MISAVQGDLAEANKFVTAGIANMEAELTAAKQQQQSADSSPLSSKVPLAVSVSVRCNDIPLSPLQEQADSTTKEPSSLGDETKPTAGPHSLAQHATGHLQPALQSLHLDRHEASQADLANFHQMLTDFLVSFLD